MQTWTPTKTCTHSYTSAHTHNYTQKTTCTLIHTKTHMHVTYKRARTHTHWQGRNPRSPIWRLGRKPLNQDRKGRHVCVSQIGSLSPCVCVCVCLSVCLSICRGGCFWAASLTLCLQDADRSSPPRLPPHLPRCGPYLPVPTLAAGRGNLLFGLKEGQEGPGGIRFSQFPFPSGPQFTKLKNGRMVSGGDPGATSPSPSNSAQL